MEFIEAARTRVRAPNYPVPRHPMIGLDGVRSDLLTHVPLANSVVFDEAAIGCVPYGGTDASAPASARLYVHPRLPGVLLKKVSSQAELLSLGGSFLLYERAAGGMAYGLVGEKAFRAIKTARIPDLSVHVGYATNTFTRYTKVNSGANALAIEYGLYPGGTIAEQVTPLLAIDGFAKAYVEGSTLSNPTQTVNVKHYGRYSLDLSTNGTNPVGAYGIMAIITAAEVGEFVIDFQFCRAQDDGTAGPYPDGRVFGYMANVISFGTFRGLLGPYRGQIVADADPDIREFVAEAFDIELAIHKDWEVHAAIGTNWIGKGRTNVDTGVPVTGAGFAFTKTGFVMPSLTSWANAGVSGGTFQANGFSSLMENSFIPLVESVKDIPGSTLIQDIRSGHLLSLAYTGKSKFRRVPFDNGAAVKSAKDFMTVRAAVLKDRITNLQTQLDAQKSTIVNASGLLKKIPTTNVNLVGNPILERMITDGLTLKFMTEVNDFFKAVYNRAEKLIKNS